MNENCTNDFMLNGSIAAKTAHRLLSKITYKSNRAIVPGPGLNALSQKRHRRDTRSFYYNVFFVLAFFSHNDSRSHLTSTILKPTRKTNS